MTKNRSRSLFIVFSILLVVCLILCFVNFTIPFSLNGNYYSYSNFVANLRLGEDLSSSLRIVYRAEQADENEIETNYNELRQSTMNDLKNIVALEGYKDVTVAEYGNDGIVLQVGNLLTVEDKNAVESLIGNPTAVTFSTESNGTNPFADKDDIVSVEPMQYNDPETGEVMYIVVVQFKESEVDRIKTATSGKTVYIYFGETQFASLNYGEGAIENGIIYLQSESITSMVDATTVANQIKTGMLDLSLTQISSEYISASYGEFASLLVSIISAIVILALFAYLIVKYRHMGLVASYALLFFIVIGLFLLQSIPLVHINATGLIAMLIGLALAVDGILMILERTKTLYQGGTALYIAFREAQRETLFKNLFLNALLLVSGFICLLMPSSPISSFGWVALILSIVSVFTTLALMRLFIKMYLAFNNEDGKKCNFHKKGGQDA